MNNSWPEWRQHWGPLAQAPVPPSLTELVAATTEVDAELFARLQQRTSNTRRAAVLIVFGTDAAGNLDLLLQLRAATLGAHAGQVSFPGGGVEPGDPDPIGTALREANEEVGLRPDAVLPLALLPPLVVPVSKYQVTPVIAHWVSEHPVHAVDPAETAAVARVPIAHLADPANRCMVSVRDRYQSPAFLVPGMLVWGFTAVLIQMLLSLGGWDTSWNQSDVRELDQAWADARALSAHSGRVWK